MSEDRSSEGKPVGLVLDVDFEGEVPLLESVYGVRFAGELEEDGTRFEQNAPISGGKKRRRVKPHYCVDLLIEGKMIVELKRGINGVSG